MQHDDIDSAPFQKVAEDRVRGERFRRADGAGYLRADFGQARRIHLDQLGQPLHSFPAVTVSVCNLRPQSRGYVRITSASPLDHPEIASNYLSTKEDRDVAVESILCRATADGDAPNA